MCWANSAAQYEIILVDDGSSDGSLGVMEEMAERDPHVRVVEFRKNFGQTAAMAAGIQAATGDVIVTMDGDLQNDPTDIPKMLDLIDEGYDLVHGWRKDRQDAWLSRKLPSRIANWLISRVTVFPVHDLGCTLKAIRREIAQEIELYGEMHRFIPILARDRGAKCTEMVTKHHPRRFGQSKYGISRTLRVLLDLLTVKYLIQYLPSPMRLFGMGGLACCLVGMLSGAGDRGHEVVPRHRHDRQSFVAVERGSRDARRAVHCAGHVGRTLCPDLFRRETQRSLRRPPIHQLHQTAPSLAASTSETEEPIRHKAA